MQSEADRFYHRMIKVSKGEDVYPRGSLGERWVKAAMEAIKKDPTLLEPARKDDLLRASGCNLPGAPGPDMTGVPQRFLVVGNDADWDDLELEIRSRIRETQGKNK
jgi:hypothetical protein